MKHIIRYVCLVVVFAFPRLVTSQSLPEDITPDGETIIGSQTAALDFEFAGFKVGGEMVVVWTPKGIYNGQLDLKTGSLKWTRYFPPPGGTLVNDDIADVWYKKESKMFIIVTKGGRVFTSSFPDGKLEVRAISRMESSEVFTRLKGDALYAVSYAQFLVSRDTAKTWQSDTAGFNGIMPSSFDIDSLHYVYVAHNKGIYVQHPDSMVWNKITSFPGTNPTLIFIDRKQRILVTSIGNGRTYMSTNRGSTWTIDTAGFNKEVPASFGGDIFGNLYAITGGFLKSSKIFRSLNGTQPWTQIDAPLSALTTDVQSYDAYVNPAFRTITGDSILFVGGAIGAYISTDQGTTWKDANTGIESRIVYSFAKTTNGRSLISTSLGIFMRNLNTAQWTKTYPSQGYNPGKSLFLDATGNVYTLGVRSPSNSLFMPMKSTDGGGTWNPDTAGFYKLGTGSINQYFVDELGTQYVGSYNIAGKIFTKKAGNEWSIDSVGYQIPGATLLPVFIGSDGKGTVYLDVTDINSTRGNLLSRPRAGGTWTPDTVGLGTDQMYAMTRDKTGAVYGGTIAHGLVKKGVSGWQTVSMPAGLGNGIPFVLSVDSSGASFAGFSVLSGYNYTWRGAYFTTNGGTSWSYAGLDQVPIRQLISYGDTTYAVTYADGVYKLSRRTPLAVPEASNIPQTFVLEQNYPNPFNPRTNFEFGISNFGFVRLAVYDLLGREVALLVNEQKSAGRYKATWDAVKYPSGVYFYRLIAGAYTMTRKMLLTK